MSHEVSNCSNHPYTHTNNIDGHCYDIFIADIEQVFSENGRYHAMIASHETIKLA